MRQEGAAATGREATFAEIAKALGITKQGAWFLYKSALRKLRKKAAVRALREMAQAKIRREL